MKKDAEAVKKDTENVKEVATDIKTDTNDIKENTESLKKEMEIMKEVLREIKEHVTKKPVENTERNNLSDPEESTSGELYLCAFCFALSVINSRCEKFGVANEQKHNAEPSIFCSVVVTY